MSSLPLEKRTIAKLAILVAHDFSYPYPFVRSCQEPFSGPSLNGLFPRVCVFEVKQAIKANSGKRPIKVGKQPVEAMVLVGNSVGCLMGCFQAVERAQARQSQGQRVRLWVAQKKRKETYQAMKQWIFH